jgi:glycosyltransferase involved in cell wall biosynthesis
MSLPLLAVMPAYKPDARLSGRVEAMLAADFAGVVVVDDGSGDGSRGVFESVESIDGCVVLYHERNLGKGAALKTAFAHVWETRPESAGVVTVDADGQHAPGDCRRVAEALLADPESLVLGTRDFGLRHVPFRSWWGNNWTSVLFAVLYGRLVPDTQTGLRAFSRSLLPRLISVPGSGYEYEMAVLCRAARARMPFTFVQIRTIYEDGNASSHFNPLRDTLLIHRSLFANLFSRL